MIRYMKRCIKKYIKLNYYFMIGMFLFSCNSNENDISTTIETNYDNDTHKIVLKRNGNIKEILYTVKNIIPSLTERKGLVVSEVLIAEALGGIP